MITLLQVSASTGLFSACSLTDLPPQLLGAMSCFTPSTYHQSFLVHVRLGEFPVPPGGEFLSLVPREVMVWGNGYPALSGLMTRVPVETFNLLQLEHQAAERSAHP